MKNWSSEKKLLTAITLCYNKRDFMERAVESFIKWNGLQGSDLDYILWDQGAPYEGVSSYLEDKKENGQSYITVMGDGVNIGIGAALNRAIEYTDSEFVFKLDDDTELLPFTLPAMILVYAMARQAGYPLAVLSADVLGPGKSQATVHEYELSPGIVLEEYPCVGGGAVLISRDVIEDVGKFRDDRLYCLEDGDFQGRALQKGYRNAYLRGAYHISYCRTPEADQAFDRWKDEYIAGDTNLDFASWK